MNSETKNWQYNFVLALKYTKIFYWADIAFGADSEVVGNAERRDKAGINLL